MGYYTKFVDDTPMTDEQLKKLQEIVQIDYSPFKEEEKWYSHETDMATLSIYYPETVFTITGFGERRDDVWMAWWHNGKMLKEKAEIKIEYPVFDTSKMEKICDPLPPPSEPGVSTDGAIDWDF